MDHSRTVVFRPTASFQYMLPSQIANMIITSILISMLFAGYHLHDWQLWIGAVLIMGWVIYTLPPKSSLRLHLGEQGIHFSPQPSKFLPHLKNVEAATIKKIKIIKSKTAFNLWGSGTVSIYVLSLPENVQGRPQVCVLNPRDWQSDRGQLLVDELKSQFPALIQEQLNTSILEPVKIFDEIEDHPMALDLGRFAGVLSLGSVALLIVGFILFVFNPFESLTWGSYPQVLWWLAGGMAMFLTLIFLFHPIKPMSKLVNIVLVIPLFTAASTFLLHSGGMLVIDAQQTTEQVSLQLMQQNEHYDQWSTLQGWQISCPRTAQPIGQTRRASVQHSIFGVVRINPKRFCPTGA